ncbi:helix-turn-helix domain-containing protein [Arthrobacter woluwensis]|uniref:helix-turn-helix domain-containing protein n=1 Tax=Arthrobacter woluwensis TaxID=156980 RepID=UPI001AAFBA08|nr:helix-turn-helix transcriptional regulator [Arthrobacter woluwensis]QTF71751.1 helix-turn-helix transcriptional regulator [Arthrobacter woluwensis]
MTIHPIGTHGTLVPVWTVADRLRKAREAAGLEQNDLVRLTGMARGTISAAENGRRKPTKANLNLWALATGVPLEWIETGSINDESPSPNGGGAVNAGPLD